MTVLAAVGILILTACVAVLEGWLLVWIISWFGPELAIWQGVVIAFALSILTLSILTYGGSRS